MNEKQSLPPIEHELVLKETGNNAIHLDFGTHRIADICREALPIFGDYLDAGAWGILDVAPNRNYRKVWDYIGGLAVDDDEIVEDVTPDNLIVTPPSNKVATTTTYSQPDIHS